MNNFIPVNEPLLNGNEKKYLMECIDTGWISSEGPFIQRFEQGMADYVGRKFGIAVSNGTAALETAVQSLKLEKGSEVILPSFTIISCAQAIIKAGLTPIVVDCNPYDWNMDVTLVEDKITSKTKAIMAVHIYGLPVDMDPILYLADKYNLKVIEDAAEVHGQTYKDKKCGSFGDISIFSFYPNKHITCGEGGMILTDNTDIAARCQSIRNLCFIPSRRFIHEELGSNFRMTNMQAAIGLAQLEHLEENIEKKRCMGTHYTKLLSDIDGLRLPLTKTEYADNIYWVYGLILEEQVPFDAQFAMKFLAKKGIGTRPFFYPINKQPVLHKLGFCRNVSCPNSEYIAERGFYIPSGLKLTKEQIEQVSQSVKELLTLSGDNLYIE